MRLRTDCRGMTAIESVATMGMVALMGLVGLQFALLGQRVAVASSANVGVHQAFRSASLWLNYDLPMARTASVSDGVLTITAQLGSTERVVEYFLQEGTLRRVLKNSSGSILLAVTFSRISEFTASYHPDTGVFTYELRSEDRQGDPLAVAVSIQSRNSGLVY